MDQMLVTCDQCGVTLRVRAGSTAKRFKCPKCGAMQALGNAPAAPKPAERPGFQPGRAGEGAGSPSASPTPREKALAAAREHAELQDALAAANKSAHRPLRWAFLLTIIPLAWHTFQGHQERAPQQVTEAFEQRLAERLKAKPELQAAYEKLNQDEASPQLLMLWARAFDDTESLKTIEKIEPLLRNTEKDERDKVLGTLTIALVQKYSVDSFLPADTWAHWGLGALAAAGFLAYFCFAYPRGNARVGSLLGVGAFTGTIGIVLLLAVHYLSALATGIRMHGRGIVMLIWLILIAIAYSNSAADDPRNGFILSFLGFTVGVGLLEELCKLLPVVWHYRTDASLSWRGACVWGLVSGAGFGVSEGIMYASRYYNGEATAGIYVVRFISCVAMHAAWAGSAAILTWRRREYLKGQMGFMDYVTALWPVLLVPMILHGLYDTLLKMGMAPWALAVGAASFVFFVALQEREARAEISGAMALAGGARA